MRKLQTLGCVVAVTVAALVRAVTAEAGNASSGSAALERADEGALRVEVVDEATGSALAARIRIAPRSPLREVQVLVASDGLARRTLPSGSYRLLVSHGPEWSIAERELSVAAGSTTTLRVPLARLLDGSAFTSCELHTHTAHSPDSRLPIAERVASLAAEDVQFAVITDHNAVTDGRSALASAGIGSALGVEVTSWAPEFGHFNVINRARPPRHLHTSPLELLKEVRQDPDAFIQINHPRLEQHIGYFALGAFSRARGAAASDFPLAFDAIEVWNGYDAGSPERREELFLDWLSLVARGERISATGGSDAHASDRPPFVGYPRTYVRLPRTQAHSQSAVLSALKRGQSFVSNGPLLHVAVAGKGPGDALELSADSTSLHLEVQVEAPRWMAMEQVEVWLGEQQVAVQKLPLPEDGAQAQRASWSLDLTVGAARSLVVTARGTGDMTPLLGRADSPFAFSNPIWIVRS